MRLGATKSSATSFYNGLGNQLWDLGGARPSLDLNFAGNKNLSDSISTKNLITFTRASSGTYVDSQGVIQRATTNLLLRSEEFEITWAPTNASVSPNATTAPNGTITADTLLDDSTNGGHLIVQSISSASDNTLFTSSCYCKAFTRSWVAVTVVGKDGSLNRVWFNLSTGTQGATNGTVTNFSAINVGNGWYRIAVTASSATGGGSLGIRISIGLADNTAAYVGNGSGIYLWGAQLEQSSTVGEYIPTTSTINSAPRFDHNPTTGESLGLLVEEQRTNSLLNSEDFTAASWGTINGTVTGNTINSPAGTLTADSFAENSGANDPRMPVVFAFAAGTNYTLSVYAKVLPGSAQRYLMLVYNAGYATQPGANFDLVTGTVGTTNTATGSIQALPNGWYRCSMTPTANATGSGSFRIRIAAVNTAANITGPSAYTGDGTSGFYLWGAQLEAGAFPTSYIPTTTAAVTRAADVASISGSNFSSWYRQDEGTVFVEGQSPASGSSYLTFSDNTNNNRILYDTTSTGVNRRLIVTNGGTTQASLNHGGTPGEMLKSSFVFKANNFIACTAGLLSAEDTSGTVPTTSLMYIGSNSIGGMPVNGSLKRITFWPQRLPNATLQQITR